MQNEYRRKALEMLKEGHSDKEISVETGVSYGAIKRYFQECYADAGITTGNKRIQLVMLLTLPMDNDIVRSIVVRNNVCLFEELNG